MFRHVLDSIGSSTPRQLCPWKGYFVSKMKLTLLGSVMAFGLALAPQSVAQDATVVYADPDSYEIVVDRPIEFEPNAENFESLRDLGIVLPPEALAEEPLSEAPASEAPDGSGQTIPDISAARPLPQELAHNILNMPVNALPSIANLVDRVSPSVVNIIVTTVKYFADIS